MSAAPHLVPGESTPSAKPARHRQASLHVIPGRAPKLGRNAFGLLIGGILLLGLLTVLLLNTVLAQGAFTIHTLERSATALEVQQQALERQVEALETPESLQQKALALGMVQAGNPVFLRLRDHRVLGVPQTVTSPSASPTASSAPAVAPSPSAAATSQPRATASPKVGAAVPPPEGAESQAGAAAGAPSTQPSPRSSAAATGDGAAAIPVAPVAAP